MIKATLMTLILLCCSAWIVAQNNPSSGSTSTPQTDQSGTSGTAGSQSGQTSGSQDSGMNGSQTSIQGCLTNSGGNYILTDSSGMQYQLQGDTSKLSSHVNQQVQIKGTNSSSGSSAGMGSGSASASGSTSSAGSSSGTQGTAGNTAGTSSSTQVFNVSKVKKIASSCGTGQ